MVAPPAGSVSSYLPGPRLAASMRPGTVAAVRASQTCCGGPLVAQGICSVCGEWGRVRRGWCVTHYERWRRYGDPLPLIPKRIFGDDPAKCETYVDRSSGLYVCHLWTGGLSTGGYGRIRVGGKVKQAHVFGWELEHGPVPPGKDLDHECHNQAVRDGTCQPGSACIVGAATTSTSSREPGKSTSMLRSGSNRRRAWRLPRQALHVSGATC